MPSRYKPIKPKMKILRIAILLAVAMSMACDRKSKPKQQVQVKPQTVDLAATLDTIWRTEQIPIRKRDSAFHAYGDQSNMYKEYQSIYKKNHLINEQKVAKILKDGWPSLNEIGEQGNLHNAI